MRSHPRGGFIERGMRAFGVSLPDLPIPIIASGDNARASHFSIFVVVMADGVDVRQMSKINYLFLPT